MLAKEHPSVDRVSLLTRVQMQPHLSGSAKISKHFAWNNAVTHPDMKPQSAGTRGTTMYAHIPLLPHPELRETTEH